MAIKKTPKQPVTKVTQSIPQLLNLCDQGLVTLGITNAVKKIAIYQLPLSASSMDLTSPKGKRAVKNYRQSIVDNWNNYNANNAKALLSTYGKGYYYHLKKWVKNDNVAWLADPEPLVTYLDVERCCTAIGLDPSDFYKYIVDYAHNMPWLPSIQVCVNKIFNKSYPQQLHAKLTQWVKAAK